MRPNQPSAETQALHRSADDALADWVGAFRPEDIPAPVRADARRLLLDTIGCAASSTHDQLIAQVRAGIDAVGGRGESASVGGPRGIGLADAILLDGAKIRAQDFNDAYVHNGLVGHPSDTIAALLPVAVQNGVPGSRLLDALVLCYEIYCRLIDEFDADGDADHTAASALAIPAAIGWMLDFERPRLIAAVALAASLARSSAEIRRGQLSSAKSIANAVVASTATTLTMLARAGLTGPSGALDGGSGWFRSVFAGARIERVFAPLEHEYRISRVSIKSFACIGTAQGAVAASVAAHPEFLRRENDVTGIRVHLPHSPLLAGQVADGQRWRPRTKETADHSIPYLIAVALLDGAVTEEQYSDRRWEDPRVLAVIERLAIGVGDDPSVPAPLGARIQLSIGETASWETAIDAPLGHPLNPMTRDQQITRFLSQTRDLWPPEHAHRVIAAIEGIDDLPSAAELTVLLAAAPPREATTSAQQ